jgi:hypothetical protein
MFKNIYSFAILNILKRGKMKSKKKKVSKQKNSKVSKKKSKKTIKTQKKVSSKVNLNPKKKQLRRDFEFFARGVQRLEELRVDLNKLNTRGFEVETESIRSKLKNVSYIPDIEKELEILKSKINGSYKEKKGKPQIDTNSGIKKKIRDLEKEVQKGKRVGIKKQLTRNDIALIKKLPKIESQLRSFKQFIEDEKKEEARKKDLLRKIDPGVSFFVNDKFNLTLNEIKGELSKKLQDKEVIVQKRLQEDLEARKKNFELQYKALEERYNNRYKDKIHTDLKKEIASRFNDALKARVDEYRKTLELELGKKTNQKLESLDNEKNLFKEKLDQRSKMIIKDEEKRFKKEIEFEKNRKIREKEADIRAEYGKRERNILENLRKKEDSLRSEFRKKEAEIRLQSRIKNDKLKENLMKKTSKVIGVGKSKYLRERDRLEAHKKVLDRETEKLRAVNVKEVAKLRNTIAKQILESRVSTSKQLRKLRQTEEKLKADLKKRKTEVELQLQKRTEELEILANQRNESEVKRLEKDKIQIDQRYARLRELVELEKKREMKLKMSKEALTHIRVDLRKEFENKKEELRKEHEERIDNEKEKLKKHFEDIILAHRTRLNNHMNEKITAEVKELHRNYHKKDKLIDRRIENWKKKMDEEKGIIAKIKDNLSNERIKVQKDKEKYKAELRERLENEKQLAIKNAVEEKAGNIRSKLSKEFHNKLRLETKAKEAEFEKRKADLALEVQSKAKELFS